MTTSVSNSLVGLSVLTGANGFAALGGTQKIESAAVRLAKAGFTLAPTTPPWKDPKVAATPDSAQLSAIKRLASLIDKPNTGLPDDVQTSFTAYKALDRLRVLAQTAAASTTGSAERTKLEALFRQGLSDLQSFLGQAPSDRLDLAFGLPTRRAETVRLPARSPLEVKGEGVLPQRDTPIPGMTGAEQFTITLTRPNSTTTDTVQVDLAGTPQPPTLDSVANAINAAISAIPLRNPDGSLHIDPVTGQTSPKWLVRFVPDKSTDKWGFAIKNPALETVSIRQDNAPDAIMVAAGQTALDAPERVQLLRFDDPANGGAQHSTGSIAGFDRLGTDLAKLAAPKTTAPKGVTLSTPQLFAPTSAAAIATAPDGSLYVVGTTAGELDANRPAGTQDLTLTKIDSEGRVLWQQMLGASHDASGAAVSIAANGDVVVAGTVSGAFDGANSDGDMLVARFNAQGDEQFATLVRNIGVDQASAIATTSDGSIYVGGTAKGVGGFGAGDAVIAKLDATGLVTARRTIDAGGSEGVRALGIAQDGALLALTGESGHAVLRAIDSATLATDTASIDLGVADARALAVAADGSIAVGGARDGGALGRDGFVTRLSASLSGATTTDIATTGTDAVESLAFLNGALYAGGRTTGALSGATKTGTTDGFVVALDAASGAQLSVRQFGRVAEQTGAVRIAAAPQGASVLGAMGLASGNITPQDSALLTTHTSLRAGDSLSVRLNDGAVRKITIADDDTLASLMSRLKTALSGEAALTTPTVDGDKLLRIEAKTGVDIELIAGPAGSDALSKLGLEPQRLSVPAIAGPRDPKVRPGGTFGLALTEALSIGTAKDAAIALKSIKDAISTAQTAYRSLYWDDSKAALADAGASNGRGPSAYQQAQIARYQDALTRISGITGLT